MTAEPARRVRPLPKAGLAWLALALLATVPVRAGEAGDRHAAWEGCLERNFGIQARITGRALAADTALTVCRPSEDAYLTALSGSALLDGAEVFQARPALVDRARNRLLGRRAAL